MRFLAAVAIAAGASLAPLSQALRPPPSLDQAFIDSLPSSDFDISPRVLELSCPECRVGPNKPLSELPLDHSPRPGETFPQSVLRVNISIDDSGPVDHLMLNDCSFYPLPSRCTTLWTDQFVKSPCGTWEYAASPESAFTLTMHHLDDNLLGLGIKLLKLQLVIGRLGSKLIRDQQPEIAVKILVLPNGQLWISTDPARAPTKGPVINHPDCSHHVPHEGPNHNWCFRYLRRFRALILRTLVPVISGLFVAAAAFYIWRKRFISKFQKFTYTTISQEVGSKDEDKSQSYYGHPDTPLLDEDTPPYEEVVLTNNFGE
jgi:hypothetical protein